MWLTLDKYVHLFVVISTRIFRCADILPCHSPADVVQWQNPSISCHHIWYINPGNIWWRKTRPIANKIHILTFLENSAITFYGCWCRNCKRKACFCYTIDICPCSEQKHIHRRSKCNNTFERIWFFSDKFTVPEKKDFISLENSSSEHFHNTMPKIWDIHRSRELINLSNNKIALITCWNLGIPR